VAVGVVLGAVGVDGEVKVRPLTDFPDRLLETKRLRVTKPGAAAREPRWYEVTAARRVGEGMFALRLGGIVGREQAAALRGSRLEVEPGEVRPLPPGRFYRFQVLGLSVRDESGRVLGRVAEVLETGANDVFVVVSDEAGGSRTEVLIPALRDVVLSMDFDAGVMVVRPLKSWGESQ